MSWASRRRTQYAGGVFLFFLVVIGGPLAYKFLTIPPTCMDGKQNQGETSIDRGGPCPLLDERSLNPVAVLWARSFRVRDGSYNMMAYIQNPNPSAGVRSVQYKISLYDSNNVLVADRVGTTYIMPGTITPVFEGSINTGNRIVAHTQFDFTEPLVWQRMKDNSTVIAINDKNLADTDTLPRITASARNTAVASVNSVEFAAVVFDPAGNAFAASQTATPSIGPGESQSIVFTWPDPFAIRVGRIDIIPLIAPSPAP